MNQYPWLNQHHKKRQTSTSKAQFERKKHAEIHDEMDSKGEQANSGKISNKIAQPNRETAAREQESKTHLDLERPPNQNDNPRHLQREVVE